MIVRATLASSHCREFRYFSFTLSFLKAVWIVVPVLYEVAVFRAACGPQKALGIACCVTAGVVLGIAGETSASVDSFDYSPQQLCVHFRDER